MEIKLIDFEYAELAKEAVALIQEHLPTDWRVDSVAIDNPFHSDPHLVVTSPYKNGNEIAKPEWNIAKLIDKCQSPAHPVRKVEINFIHAPQPRILIRFRRLLQNKDITVSVCERGLTDTVNLIF